MAGPELSVVCRNCGSEVSPYVTECPYCGTRLRKRAPKLQRERRERLRAGTEELSGRPVATGILLGLSAILFIAFQIGGEVGLRTADLAYTDPQRYLAAPFFFEDAGYLFVCGLAIAIFYPALERRIGTVPALILGLGCGALGILAADGVSAALGDGLETATGANGIALGGIAAYIALREPERRADPEESYDPVAVAVAAAAVLAISFIETLADPVAALAGGLVGGICGWFATLGHRGTEP
jgi:membrane associated rhomboid family serine protease